MQGNCRIYSRGSSNSPPDCCIQMGSNPIRFCTDKKGHHPSGMVALLKTNPNFDTNAPLLVLVGAKSF